MRSLGKHVKGDDCFHVILVKAISSSVGYYNGFGHHYTHEHRSFVDRSICGNDLHDDVGSTLVPVTSENWTYSTYLFTQEAIGIIEAQDPEEVSEEIFISKHVGECE